MRPEQSANDPAERARDVLETREPQPRLSAGSRRVVRVVAAVATMMAVVVGGVVLATTDTSPKGPSDQKLPAAAAGDSQTSEPPEESMGSVRGVRVGVPVLVEYLEDIALQRVQARGLTAEVVRRFEACRPAGTVFDQDPGAGRKVAVGSLVTIVVANQESEEGACPQGVAFEPDRTVAAILYSFSRDPGLASPPPWAPRVTLSLFDDQMQRTVTERQASDPERWQFALPLADDDVYLLDVLADSDGQYRVDVGAHPTCVGPERPPPSVFAGLRQVSITPTAARKSCLDWWAVDYFLNDVGQIQGVTLVRWES